MKKSIRFGLTLGITAAIFYLISVKIDVYSSLKILLTTDITYFPAVILLMTISLSIKAKRWQIILETMGYNLYYTECFYLILAAFPLSSITPSKSGDLIKAYYLRDRLPASRTVGSIIAEQLLDILTLISFSFLGIAYYRKYMFIPLLFVLLLVCLIIIHISLRLSIKIPWNDKIQNIAFATNTLIKDKKAMVSVILYSILGWFSGIIQILLFFYALEIEVPLMFTVVHIPIAIFVGMIPVTLGGMGTRDTAIIILFSEFATPEKLLGVGILISVFRYWLISLLGLPFMYKMIHKQ